MITAEQTSAIDEAKTAICSVLGQWGISRVEIDYDGQGDEGQNNDIRVLDIHDQETVLPAGNCLRVQSTFKDEIIRDETSIETAIDSFATEVLETLHNGWANNDGASGTIEIDVAEGRATLQHYERFISTNHFEHQV